MWNTWDPNINNQFFWCKLNHIATLLSWLLCLPRVWCIMGLSQSWAKYMTAIGICCFSAKHAVLRSKSKHWLAWIHYNVSGWSDMSTHKLLFQWARTIKIQLGLLNNNHSLFRFRCKFSFFWYGDQLINNKVLCRVILEVPFYTIYQWRPCEICRYRTT